MKPFPNSLSRPVALCALALAVVQWAPGSPATALGAPADPARYEGTATYYDEPAAIGMLVSAHVEGELVAVTEVFEDEEGDRVYELDVPADNPETPAQEGVGAGEVVDFRVHGVLADQMEIFDAGEVRNVPLTVTKIEICIGAFEDMDEDGAWDPAEPLLAGVEINLLQFFLVRNYESMGMGEPSCQAHDPMDTVVRAVNGPDGYEPLGAAPLGVLVDQDQGSFVVMFPYVRLLQPTGTVSPTTTPATPTPTPEVFPGPTGQTPVPTVTPTASTTPSPTPSPTATPTATDGPTPTATSTNTASATPTATATPTVTPTPTATTDPSASGQIIVNDPADPGTVGDDLLTLREAIRLATGDLALGALSAAERAQVSAAPGAASSDTILFDPAVFPQKSPATIEVQPPVPTPGPSPTPMPPGSMLPRDPHPGLPPLSTGGDIIDATGRGVILSAGLGREMFDGLLLNSDSNALRGLELRSFDSAVVVAGAAEGNAIGGDMPGQGLVLADNIAGVVLRGEAVRRTFVLGNHIGVERDGETAAGNATFGVLILEGASANQIGAAGAGNVIAANFLDGIAVLGEGTGDNVLQGNKVGTNSAGARALGNGIGIVIGGGAEGTIVGGLGFGANVVSGNVGDGIWLQGEGTTFALVQGNTIGLAQDRSTRLPNGGAGVLVSDGARDNFIGGTDGRAANWISFNQGGGVVVRGAETVGNTIRRNRITAHEGKGIALTDGGNGGIERPVVTEVDRGLFLIAGIAPPNSLIDIYSDEGDEGAMFEFTTRADASGRFRVARAFTGPRLSVTATDADGSTSEFGQLAGAPTSTPAPVTATATATPGTPGTGTLQPPPVTLEPGQVADRAYLPFISQEVVLFARVFIEPPVKRLPMGGMATFEIRAADVRDLFGLEITLSYDPARLQIIDSDPAAPGVQIEPGDFPAPARRFVAENNVDEAAGHIRYAFTLIEGDAAAGSGVVARFKLRARGPGTSLIQFDDLMLLDASVSPLRASGRGARVIVARPPTGVPPTDTPTATATSTPRPATATASPTPQPTATTTPSITPSPRPTATPTVTATATVTETPEPTNTPVPGETPPTATLTPPPTETSPPTATPTVTETASPSVTPTASLTAEPSATPTASASATATAPPTETSPPTATLPPSATPLPTETSPPTATLVPSATPRPGDTPVPTPDGCRRPLVNGGFENEQGWTFRGARPPRYTSAMGHSGMRSLVVGILSDEPNRFAYSSLWQPVRVPADAETMTVAAWTFQEAQAGGGADRQMLLVYDVDPALNVDGQRAPIGRVFSERSDAKAWQRRVRTFDVTAHRNQTLWVYSTVVNDGLGGRAWMFLDDLSVAFCR